MIDDDELNLVMWKATMPFVTAARAMHGPLPSVTSDAFRTAPITLVQATLMVVGVARVHQGDPVRALLREVSNDVHNGDVKFWRNVAANHVPFDELQRRRGVTAA